VLIDSGQPVHAVQDARPTVEDSRRSTRQDTRDEINVDVNRKISPIPGVGDSAVFLVKDKAVMLYLQGYGQEITNPRSSRFGNETGACGQHAAKAAAHPEAITSQMRAAKVKTAA